MTLSGQKALITGASRGIGRATALRFAAEGADVVLTARSAASLSEVVAAVEAQGRRAFALAWDLLDFSATEARLAEARDLLGGLDILVNNAGVVRLPEDHPDPTPEAAWDYVMDTNLKSLYFVCRAAAELMRAQGHGVIVNLASDAGLRGASSAYGASKWGVIGLTRGLAQEFAPSGVRINGLAPGPVATGMMGCPDGQPREDPHLPLGRYALPEEVAAVALFLAGPDSRAVFGDTIVINSANP